MLDTFLDLLCFAHARYLLYNFLMSVDIADCSFMQAKVLSGHFLYTDFNDLYSV